MPEVEAPMSTVEAPMTAAAEAPTVPSEAPTEVVKAAPVSPTTLATVKAPTNTPRAPNSLGPITAAERGFDRKPDEHERHEPPDMKPWTDYDNHGNRQQRPPLKACVCYFPGLCVPIFCCCPCCVVEPQWCLWCGCGDDADQCCDVCMRCELYRMQLCCCYGPRCDNLNCCCGRECQVNLVCCKGCRGYIAAKRVGFSETFTCTRFIERAALLRYSGCQLCCCHVTMLACPKGCENVCCCEEERLFMDGDLKPIRSTYAK